MFMDLESPNPAQYLPFQIEAIEVNAWYREDMLGFSYHHLLEDDARRRLVCTE